MPKVTTVTRRCAAWDGQQCKRTTKLTNCVMRIQQGELLKGPVSVVVPLCGEHFQLHVKESLKKKLLSASQPGSGEGQ